MIHCNMVYLYQIEGKNERYFALYRDEKEFSFESFNVFTNSVIRNFISEKGIRYDVPPNLPNLKNNNRSINKRMPLDHKTIKDLEKLLEESFKIF